MTGPGGAGRRVAASRFNFHVPTREGPLLFNASSGAVLALEGPDSGRLSSLLCDAAQADYNFSEALSEAALNDLSAGGFVVGAGADEVRVIRDRFWDARRDTPVVLTLTTTMDCNLGCYYCYEDRTGDALVLSDVAAIVALAATRVAGRRNLHVDWYGGEPLLNVDFIEAASAALRRYCADHGVRYSASVISNGTCWPEDVEAFIARHAITQVQISFDGLRENHDRRRRFRPGRNAAEASSFELAVALVDRLVRCVRVDVRFNIDRANQVDLLPFLRFAQDRRWFDGERPATFQPARLSSYSDRSAFMRSSELSVAEYDALRAAVRSAAGGRFAVDESEAPEGFPHPRTSVCAALAAGSVVVGADRRMYRCGLQVSEPNRAVGALRPSHESIALPVWGQDAGDRDWWEAFDPTERPRCGQCSFLPVCWGGCPKKHLEADQHALLEQGVYWRQNLARLVAQGAGRTPIDGFEFSEAEQFRCGEPAAATTADVARS